MPRSLLFTRAPRWFRFCRRGGGFIAEPALDWLREPGSLTRRLRKLCGSHFRVVLLRQDWARPFADESRILGMSPGRRAVIREVALQFDDKPLVLARSVIPAATLRGAGQNIMQLGCRPLGEILFADPHLRRSSAEWSRPDAAFWKSDFRELAAADPAGYSYGRRSLYTLSQNHSLLVAEFFLPDLFVLDKQSLCPPLDSQMFFPGLMPSGG